MNEWYSQIDIFLVYVKSTRGSCILANKKHREAEREVFRILDINKNTTIEEYTDYLKQTIKNLEFQDGITLSGGDPLCQIDACLEIAKFCQSIGLNVWCYTGYKIEDLLKRSEKEKNLKKILDFCHVLY